MSGDDLRVEHVPQHVPTTNHTFNHSVRPCDDPVRNREDELQRCEGKDVKAEHIAGFGEEVIDQDAWESDDAGSHDEGDEDETHGQDDDGQGACDDEDDAECRKVPEPEAGE